MRAANITIAQDGNGACRVNLDFLPNRLIVAPRVPGNSLPSLTHEISKLVILQRRSRVGVGCRNGEGAAAMPKPIRIALVRGLSDEGTFNPELPRG